MNHKGTNISVIIPANNEEKLICKCLRSLLSSREFDGVLDVIVVANGCLDSTAAEALKFAKDFTAKGWTLHVSEIDEGNKVVALNVGDTLAKYENRIYLDADVKVSRLLIVEISKVLRLDSPVYASGRLVVPKPNSLISECYARFWVELPFISGGVPGCGLFAVNKSGRRRWGLFPNIISDDTYVRYHFRSEEMHIVSPHFEWPITEGFRALVKVRRRQNRGIEEIRLLYPELSSKVKPTMPTTSFLAVLFLKDPIGFLIYSAVSVAVKLPIFNSGVTWYRGR